MPRRMGRPRNRYRSSQIRVTVSVPLRRLAERAATVKQRTLSSWVRELIEQATK